MNGRSELKWLAGLMGALLRRACGALLLGAAAWQMVSLR